MTILAKQFVGKRNSESADLPAAENGQATEASVNLINFVLNMIVSIFPQ